MRGRLLTLAAGPLLGLALALTATSCAKDLDLRLPASAYDAAFDGALREARTLGYETVSIDRPGGRIEVIKGCGCNDLVVTFRPIEDGYDVEIGGSVLFSHFHNEADRVRDSILQAGARIR